MHDKEYQNLSWWHCAPNWQSEPITWSKMALFYAMYGSPTMNGLTHHGHEMNSRRQRKLTQSVLGRCMPLEEEYAFLFMHRFVVFLESYFYDSNSLNHSKIQIYFQLTSLVNMLLKYTLMASLCILL